MQRVQGLIERAKTATGLEDFGDEGYREGLERLVSAIDCEARLNENGKAMSDRQIADLLGWRLQIEHWYSRDPRIEDEQIVAPLIGLGLPRTGSTALGCMLAADPAVRSIRGWESSAPCPPPETATERTDGRIERQRAILTQRDGFAPRLKQMLPSAPDQATECQTFMAYDFKSKIFQSSLRIPSYVAWLNYEADLVPTYTYVKRVLKLLQSRCPPRRWRLKNPSHIVFIEALDKVFPDARYWMTHRDVTKVIPSVVDLYRELSASLTDEIDGDYIVRTNIEWAELGMRRMMDFRADGNEHRFFDIGFNEFQARPSEVIERLYAFLGEPLTDAARAGMIAWRESTPADKHGRHVYDAAKLGIDLDGLRARFHFYENRYGPEMAAVQ